MDSIDIWDGSDLARSILTWRATQRRLAAAAVSSQQILDEEAIQAWLDDGGSCAGDR